MAFATIGNSALTGSIDLTSKVTGALPVGNGGTGITSGTSGHYLKFSGSTTIASAAVASAVVGDEIDSWSYNTSTSTTGATLTTNWERTTGYFNLQGTGMSCNNSTGVFTFPSTGFYLVTYKVVFNSQNTTTYVQNSIIMNGGSVTSNDHINTTNDSQHQTYGEAMYKVDDTSADTVKFDTNFGGNTNQVLGAADNPYTGVTFLKLRAV